MLDRIHPRQLLSRDFLSQRSDTRSDHGGLFGSRFAGDVLGGRKSFPSHAMQPAVLMLKDCKNLHRILASNFSFSTSFAAAVLGSPSKICACRDFSGAYSFSICIAVGRAS